MHDIALALMAVQTRTTEVLDSFPRDSGDAESGGDTADDHSDRSGPLTLPEYICATYGELAFIYVLTPFSIK